MWSKYAVDSLDRNIASYCKLPEIDRETKKEFDQIIEQKNCSSIKESCKSHQRKKSV